MSCLIPFEARSGMGIQIRAEFRFKTLFGVWKLPYFQEVIWGFERLLPFQPLICPPSQFGGPPVVASCLKVWGQPLYSP